jgi:hypothetical protein
MVTPFLIPWAGQANNERQTKNPEHVLLLTKSVAERVVTCSGSSPLEKSWAAGSYNPSVPGITTEAHSKNCYGKVRKERAEVKGKKVCGYLFRQVRRKTGPALRRTGPAPVKALT